MRTLQARHGSNLVRDTAGEVVDIEVEISEAGEVADLLGNVSRQGIEVQVETSQAPELTDCRGERPSETSPLQGDVDDDVTTLVAGDTLECSNGSGIAARVSCRFGPGGEVGVVWVE